MSLKAYEDACLRAELFGQPKPDKEEFLEMHKHLDVVEFDEVDIRTGENTAMLNEDLKAASGGLTELNTILHSTQTKLNRMKGVCGSLSNYFRGKFTSGDNLSYSTGPSYIGHTNYDKDSGIADFGVDKSKTAGETRNVGDIESSLSDLKTMENNKNKASIDKNKPKDVGATINSQVDKLDKLISLADRAESSMSRQNKQMRSMIR